MIVDCNGSLLFRRRAERHLGANAVGVVRGRSVSIGWGASGKIRVVIIAGDRMKTHARGNRVSRSVLGSSEHGCDRVIVDCDGSMLFRRRAERH